MRDHVRWLQLLPYPLTGVIGSEIMCEGTKRLLWAASDGYRSVKSRVDEISAHVRSKCSKKRRAGTLKTNIVGFRTRRFYATLFHDGGAPFQLVMVAATPGFCHGATASKRA